MKRVLALFVSLVAGVVSAATPLMRPGLWEMTVSMEMPGMPQSMPPTTVQHCYRAEDVKDLRRTVPKQGNCKVADWKKSGNAVTWTMHCRGGSAATITGKMTYDGDRFSGTSEINMTPQGQKMHITQRYDARRIGDCK